MGSIIAVRKATAGGDAPTRVMLAAHMDQIGFLVRHVGSDGFLRVHNVGGFDPRNLFARLVNVATEGGDLPGVLNPGGKPVHLANAEERKKVPEITDLLVDLGLPAEQVQAQVKIGDMVTLAQPFTLVGNTAVGQCLDNRVACWLVIESLRQMVAADTRHACEIHAVFTVQEEVGLRGALTSAHTVMPDIDQDPAQHLAGRGHRHRGHPAGGRRHPGIYPERAHPLYPHRHRDGASGRPARQPRPAGGLLGRCKMRRGGVCDSGYTGRSDPETSPGCSSAW